MQRNKIKADGTVYAVKDWNHVTPARVIETDRLWTHVRHGWLQQSNTIKPANPRVTMSSTDRPSGYTNSHHYTGFVIVRAAQRDAEALEALRVLDLSTVDSLPYDEAGVLLAAWAEKLPEGLKVDVAVTRQFLATWDDHVKAQADKDAQYRADAERRHKAYERADGVRKRLDAVLKTHGLSERYSSVEGRALVSLDAEQFMELIERLEGRNDA